LTLGLAHGLLGHVVGERHAHVGGKAPHVIPMQTQAVNQVECLALLGPAALAGCALAGIGQAPLLQNPMPANKGCCSLPSWQGSWAKRSTASLA